MPTVSASTTSLITNIDSATGMLFDDALENSLSVSVSDELLKQKVRIVLNESCTIRLTAPRKLDLSIKVANVERLLYDMRTIVLERTIIVMRLFT